MSENVIAKTSSVITSNLHPQKTKHINSYEDVVYAAGENYSLQLTARSLSHLDYVKNCKVHDFPSTGSPHLQHFTSFQTVFSTRLNRNNEPKHHGQYCRVENISNSSFTLITTSSVSDANDVTSDIYMCGRAVGVGFQINNNASQQTTSSNSHTLLYSWSNDNLISTLQKVENDFLNLPKTKDQRAFIVDSSTGFEHSVIVLSNGMAMACGRNKNGQCGTGNFNDVPKWEIVPTNYHIVKTSCGSYHTAFLAGQDANSSNVNTLLYCGTFNNNGSNIFHCKLITLMECINNSSSSSEKKPTLGVEDEQFVDVKCGQNFTCVLTSSGNVYAFGRNAQGQCGTGVSTIKDVSKPTLMKGLDKVKISKIACGSSHTLLLTNTHFVYGVGNNESGQLGMGDVRTRYIPERNEFFAQMWIWDRKESSQKTLTSIKWPYEELPTYYDHVKDIACGPYHSAFVTICSDVYVCGLACFGQLGIGVFANGVVVPVKVNLHSTTPSPYMQKIVQQKNLEYFPPSMIGMNYATKEWRVCTSHNNSTFLVQTCVTGRIERFHKLLRKSLFYRGEELDYEESKMNFSDLIVISFEKN
ncbi:hypothetical protein C9374_006848 [Naegleria lovaniensis]|uniref:Uncharacterized protein n=1 Tax=Naegleria lovaniensis TaxID=51637 RepID=A0AA88H5S4_NAELO|nr:uncharacterized protein C9374_006848 [Naegleria lovaniensis]KAG2393317.1 hypothetical protein C9374_006848 [Naegleria lovaniensis]